MSAIWTSDGCLVSDVDGQMARWAEYFEQLFKVNPPSGRLQTTVLQEMDADPPINQHGASHSQYKLTPSASHFSFKKKTIYRVPNHLKTIGKNNIDYVRAL